MSRVFYRQAVEPADRIAALKRKIERKGAVITEVKEDDEFFDFHLKTERGAKVISFRRELNLDDDRYCLGMVYHWMKKPKSS